MPEWLIGFIAGSGFLTAGFVFLINMVSDDKLREWGFAAGKAITTAGKTRLAKFGISWNPIENVIQKKLVPLVEGIERGLDSDDK